MTRARPDKPELLDGPSDRFRARQAQLERLLRASGD
jgi:hypothetical protein